MIDAFAASVLTYRATEYQLEILDAFAVINVVEDYRVKYTDRVVIRTDFTKQQAKEAEQEKII